MAEDFVLLPEMEVTISVQDSRNVAATSQALREHNLAVVVPSDDLAGMVGSIGVLVHLRKVRPASQGVQSETKGLWRVRIDGIIEDKPYVRLRFSRADSDDDSPSESSTMKAVFGQIDEFTRLIPGIPPEIISMLKEIDRPGRLADMCAYSPFFTNWDRLDLLRTIDPEERLGKVKKLFDLQLGELKKLADTKTIMDCPTCMELANKAFDLGPSAAVKVAREFLDHVTREHPDEVLGLLAEKYGPAFLRRRSFK